jgi:CHAT domain-containing protein
VSWEDIKETIERVYGSRLGKSKLNLETIEGADPMTLLEQLQTRDFDVAHFSCHGDVDKGMGRLMLVDAKTGRTAFITADELGKTLAGRDLRLVILSACDTSKPADFGSTAETLIEQGIPAVVANQAPVPNASMAPFVAALYTELRRSGNIDKAVTQGRIALSTTKGPEWGITTLHRLSGAAQLYNPDI